jgi:oligopeptide/dipeptide ABC transporter ATP-binding protein|tara:strand:- start:4946 stop:5968 length:1023 start_codon:yes stop_codon:yes gene_type:complete
MKIAKKLNSSNDDLVLLSVKGLKTFFKTRRGLVHAVDGVNLAVRRGESLGVVGESGSGKTITFASVMGLIRPPGWIESGSIVFDGRELVGLPAKAMRNLRGKSIAMTMQDSLTALNPAFTVGYQIMESILAHDETIGGGFGRGRRARKQAIEMMRLVGIPDAAERLNDYPHQFSGGMRQRIMVATALACRPKLLIADEPTTALDVTIQAQVLELIEDMKKTIGMSVVIITHDLGVVTEHCNRIVIMYSGQVVESGFTREIIEQPRHPYTVGLLRSIPNLSHLDQPILPIEGTVPDSINPPEHCRFLERCSERVDSCRKPVELRMLKGDREVRCLRVEEEL